MKKLIVSSLISFYLCLSPAHAGSKPMIADTISPSGSNTTTTATGNFTVDGNLNVSGSTTLVLPNPSPTTLGGVESLTCGGSNWLYEISTSGVPVCSQPNFTDLLGTISTAQIAANAVTTAKMATIPNNAVLGNTSGSTAVPSPIPLAAFPTASPTPSAVLALDQNSNALANEIIHGSAVIATSGTQDTLTVASAPIRIYTGSTAQAVQLPVTSTLKVGWQFLLESDTTGSGAITVTNASAGAVCTIPVVSGYNFNALITYQTGTTWECTLMFGGNSSTPTTPVAYGGTGINIGTSGGVPYFSGTGTIASSGLLAQYGIVLGGGAGNSPATLAPSSSTGFCLLSNGAAANPSWGACAPSFTNQSANAVLAGPASGSAATPTFRAQVYADISPAVKAPTVQTFLIEQNTFTVTSLTTTTTAGAVYTDANNNAFTVLTTANSGTTTLVCTSSQLNNASITSPLTYSSGGTTHQTSIAFSAQVAGGTYTLPTSPSPLYIEVTGLGGGGGGGGSGTTSGTAGVAGQATTFGSSLLSASGGGVGVWEGNGGTGGAASLGSGPLGIAVAGGRGGGYTLSSTSPTSYVAGGMGGSSALGGAGSNGAAGGNGQAAATNTGGGGGGAPGATTSNTASGSGGGSGGYFKAIIISPASTYSYSVGVGGIGQGAGSSGQSGGAGALGAIYVVEHYQ